MNCIPIYYRPPLGLPLNWRDELSGVLPKAVEAYLDNRIENKTVTDEQITILRKWLHHYIHAPCWDTSGFEDELLWLRTTVCDLDSCQEIAAWLEKCMEIGLDPL